MDGSGDPRELFLQQRLCRAKYPNDRTIVIFIKPSSAIVVEIPVSASYEARSRETRAFRSERTSGWSVERNSGPSTGRVVERAKKKEGKAGGRGSYTTVGSLPREGLPTRRKEQPVSRGERQTEERFAKVRGSGRSRGRGRGRGSGSGSGSARASGHGYEGASAARLFLVRAAQRRGEERERERKTERQRGCP